MVPGQLNNDALGRTLDTLYVYGVTALYRLMAATAAQRLGPTPRCAHLERTSFHINRCYNSDEEPAAQVIHITPGYSRDHRPDLIDCAKSVVIYQGGLDWLCLESHGISAVTSTGGAGTFKAEWAGLFHDIPEVYGCFDHDVAGRLGAERVTRLIPHTRGW